MLRSNNCWLDKPAICNVVKACNCTELRAAIFSEVKTAKSAVSSTAICLVVNAFTVALVKLAAWLVVKAVICAVVNPPTVVVSNAAKKFVLNPTICVVVRLATWLLVKPLTLATSKKFNLVELSATN